MKKIKYFISIILFGVATFGTEATVIVFKDGDVITGQVITEKNGKIQFRSPYGKIEVKKKNIKKLIVNESDLVRQEVTFKKNKIQVRLIDETYKQKIYLTEKGKVIKINKPAKKKSLVAKESESKNSILLSMGMNLITLPDITMGSTPGSLLLVESLKKMPVIDLQYMRSVTSWLRVGLMANFWYYEKTKSFTGSNLTLKSRSIFYSMSGGVRAEIPISFFINNKSALEYGFFGHVAGHRTSSTIQVVETSDTAFSLENAYLSGSSIGLSTGGGLYGRYHFSKSLALHLGASYEFIFLDRLFSAKKPKSPSLSDKIGNEAAKLSTTSVSIPNGFSFRAGIALQF